MNKNSNNQWSIIGQLMMVFFCTSIVAVNAADDILNDEDDLFGSSMQKKVYDIPAKIDQAPLYIIGPQDSLNIFVWRNPDLSQSVTVRPDGRISIPLVEDLLVTGKTPTQLARDVEKELGVFVKDPIVTIIVSGFLGPFNKQIRVVGEATTPMALPFYEGMTLLDLMISVGGVTEFASGNSAKIFRVNDDGKRQEFEARIDDLIKDGDIKANVDMLPGDILIIPESWF